MDCIINELSLRSVETVVKANHIIENFVQCITNAQLLGIKQVRLPKELGSNLYYLALADNYYVSTWLDDNRVDIDIRNKFRVITTTSPFLTINELVELSERSIFRVTLPNHNEKEAQGFGAAYIEQLPLVSFLTDAAWDAPYLTGSHWFLDQDSKEQTEFITIHHFSRLEHLSLHKNWIQQEITSNISSGSELWERQSGLFPNLTLCGEVKKQLKNLGFSKYLTQIISHLRTLNSYTNDWPEDKSFSLQDLIRCTNLDVSGESESTMSKYGHQRRFKLYNGRYEYFELHIKSGNLRLHFYPDSEQRRVYVGYIGPHLDVVSG